MSAASPEPKGTLTPPGSSPLRADSCCTSPITTSPSSPQAPPTPDSAHCIPHTTANERLQPNPATDTPHNLSYVEKTEADRKRKTSDTHRDEIECGSEGEGESAASTAVVAEGALNTPLTCPVCQEVLLGQHDFTQHIRKHNHVIEADNGTRMYGCGICKKQLSSNSSLDRHMLVHSGERPFRCHICGTHFTTNGNMHRHIRGHYRNGGSGPGGSDTGDSDTCSDTGSSPKKRRLEDDDSLYAKSPRTEDKEVSCPVCGLEQANQHAMGLHVEAAHPEYQVACHTCQLGFKNYRALHLHNSMVHADSPQTMQPNIDLMNTEFSTSKFPLIVKEFQEANSKLQLKEEGTHMCVICNRSFSSTESYKNHMAEHSSVMPPPLRCLRCDISFSSLPELAQHHQSHLREETGYPPPPKESFLAVLDLLTKQQTAPSPSSTVASLLGWKPPLMLPPPGQHSPAQADSAKASPEHPTPGHTITAPPQMSPMVPPGTSLSHEEQFNREYREMKLNGQYPCRLCKEVFANLRKLKSHNLVHMVAPPYRCNLCTFYSNDKNTLKEHMKSHKGDTPYECTICNLAFTTKANCERHIKNIHARNTRDEIKTCMSFISQEDGLPMDRSLDTICHICHIDCKARSVLRDHMRSSHPEGMAKPFSCKLCGSSFSSENDVMRHAIQQHNDMARVNRLENLVMQSQPHIFREDIDDEHLSSVDKLVSFAKIPLLPFPRIAPPLPPTTMHSIPNPISIPNPMLPPPHLATPTISPLVSTTVEEDAPLDLSMGSKKEIPSDDKKENVEDEDDEEVKVDDDEEEKPVKEEHQEEPEDLSKTRKEDDEPTEVKPETSHADILRIPKPPFPLGGVYPPHLPLTAFPPHQYPFLMPPYGGLPPGYNFDPAILEEYQKELKRGLQLTSGGGLLPGGGFLQNGAPPSFPLSALALAATQRDQLRIPRPEFRNVEIKSEEGLTEDRLSKPGEEDILHFTMRNSVLVKKPKQRRYRTERPWRCDLCDKGFTLRSNMERHMKQQHPDLWQQRPRLPEPRLDGDISSSVSDSSHSLSDAVREQLKYKFDRDAGDETGEQKEEDDIELVIDDEPEEDEEEEEEEECEDDEYEEDDDEGESIRRQEEGGADLASVHKLLSTATSQSFPFFGSEGEEDQGAEDEDSCESPADSKMDKNEEKRSAYSSAPQKQRCPFCQRKFPWSSSLVRHIRTHTGQKPYLCPVCHFPFTTKSNCDRHLIRKHPDSPHTLGGDRPFRCSKCPGAAFTSLESLRKHEMFKHEKASDTAIPRDDTRPFRCHVCEARLVSRDAALVHVTEAHPEHVQSIRTTSPPPKDNNNDVMVTSPDSTTTDMVACMFCLQRCWSLAELKQHVTNHHVNGPSPSDSEDQPACMPSTTPKTEAKEDRKDEVEGTDFISDLLGTRRAVVDHLINSKSADDAAKLLGVH